MREPVGLSYSGPRKVYTASQPDSNAVRARDGVLFDAFLLDSAQVREAQQHHSGAV